MRCGWQKSKYRGVKLAWGNTWLNAGARKEIKKDDTAENVRGASRGTNIGTGRMRGKVMEYLGLKKGKPIKKTKYRMGCKEQTGEEGKVNESGALRG